MLQQVITIGLPSGLQNSIISIANVVVQSNITAFGEMAMAGCGAYLKLEVFAALPDSHVQVSAAQEWLWSVPDSREQIAYHFVP